MKRQRTISIIAVALLAIAVSAGQAWGRPDPAPQSHTDPQPGPMRSPAPTTVDQIVHNGGNIATTVDNYGLIGGYWNQLPSGEWPRNSGHNYLAEIRYWMGATISGDTLVANTADDFQSMQSLISDVGQYKIMLSTDTTRYYDYSKGDTVGAGYGNPSYGWRVWNPDSSAWLRAINFSPSDSVYYQGGPRAVQESFYRFNDAALGTPLLGLELTHTVLQWNFCYNEDFMFVILEITNNSGIDYTDFAFGLYVDIDVGGPDGTGENGRLQDLVSLDTASNLAWIYDNIGVDPGWGHNTRTGIMGTKLLETPNDIGMTGFRTNDWAFLPRNDRERYRYISAPQVDAPLPPTDQFYVQCVSGINLAADSTVRVVYALVAGANETDFRANADVAQGLYDKHFAGPVPPVTPNLQARAGDHRALLYWDDTSEVGMDPIIGEPDFVGYKLYRSDNQGKTWGVVDDNSDNDCLGTEYFTVATYKVNQPGDPIPHTFIDTGLYNGVEYWYCLAAFDNGDSSIGVSTLQSGFGEPGQVSNVIAVRPRNNAAGYQPAEAEVVHDYIGLEEPSEGDVLPYVFYEDSLTATDFRVVFEEYPDTTYWHLLDAISGDTILADQSLQNPLPEDLDIFQGLRLAVVNGDRNPRSAEQTAFGGSGTTLALYQFWGPTIPNFAGGDTTWIYGDMHYRSTYELRYTGNVTVAPNILELYGYPGRYDVPFEIWNTTTNQRVNAAVFDWDLSGTDGVWDPGDLLAIVNTPYDAAGDFNPTAFPVYYSWMFEFDTDVYNPTVGDVFTVEGAPMNGPDDVFTFKLDNVDAVAAHYDLDDIRVVPDPYIVQYSSLVETSEGEAVIEFQKVPDRCTIRIYSLAGDLVQTIQHDDGTGVARWNLLTLDQRQVASGMYIYHVESPYGDHMGRFAVIK